jgi:hypothetical protein
MLFISSYFSYNEKNYHLFIPFNCWNDLIDPLSERAKKS